MDLRVSRSNESRVREIRRRGPPLQQVSTLEFCRIDELELRFEIRSQFPATLTVHALGAKYLMDLEMVSFESVRRAGHVETPHACALFTDLIHRFVETLDQVGNPVTQREPVVLAKTFKVTDFESVGLEH